MTLHTQILTHQRVDAKELHTWVNVHLLHAPEAKFSEKPGELFNELDQGLAALMWVTADPEGGVHKEWWQEDGEWEKLDEDEREYYSEKSIPSVGYTVLHLDTAYGYDPAITHARMIAQLDVEFFQPRGITFSWYNEFTDEWHEGNEGLLEFAGPHGFAAEDWFKHSVKPALKQPGVRWQNETFDGFNFPAEY